jgi:hypothetical protein
MLKVFSHSFTNIARKRQPVLTADFTSYDKLSGIPIDVVQRHMNHISGTQAEPG